MVRWDNAELKCSMSQLRLCFQIQKKRENPKTFLNYCRIEFHFQVVQMLVMLIWNQTPDKTFNKPNGFCGANLDIILSSLKKMKKRWNSLLRRQGIYAQDRRPK